MSYLFLAHSIPSTQAPGLSQTQGKKISQGHKHQEVEITAECLYKLSPRAVFPFITES